MSRPLRLKPFLGRRFDYEFYHIRPSLHLNYYLDYATTYAKLGLRLARRDFDAVLVWNLYYLPLISAIDEFKKIIDITDVERAITHSRWLKGILVDAVERKWLGEADLSICADYGVYRKLLSSDINLKVEYVPNGVDLQLFKPHPDAEIRYDACYLGKIERQYALESMVDGLAESGANCLFIGRGEDMEYYKSYAREAGAKADFVGFVDYPRVPQMLCSCRMGLVPDVESASLKLLEYLACGLPAASPGTLDPALADVVTPIKEAEASEYAEAIERIRSMTPEEHSSISRKCRKAVLPFSLEATSNRYCDIIEAVI